MSHPTRTIDLDQACDGMVLAADLLDASAKVLLPAGATLTASMREALARRGIASVDIVGEESDEQREAERARQCARLALLFRHSANAQASEGASAILLEHLLHYRRTR